MQTVYERILSIRLAKEVKLDPIFADKAGIESANMKEAQQRAARDESK